MDYLIKKTPMIIEEQVENLKSIGLSIEDEDYAKKIVNDILTISFGVLLCIRQLVKNDSHCNMFVQNIELLFDKYERVDIKTNL